jgi:predicted ribosome-associated RNA-binding protein Tma20
MPSELESIIQTLQENNEEQFCIYKEQEVEIKRLKDILRAIANWDSPVFSTDVEKLYAAIYGMKNKAEEGL